MSAAVDVVEDRPSNTDEQTSDDFVKAPNITLKVIISECVNNHP